MINRFKLITSNRDALIQQIDVMLSQCEAVEVNAKPWSDKRSLPANAQVHVWYGQIAKIDGDDVVTVECFCKRMFGLPILQQSKEYGDKINWTLNKLGFFEWPWESQCNYMELLPVTRLFDTKKHNEYRDTMQSYYNKNGYQLDYL